MVEAQDVPIVRRVCPSCSRQSHKDIYYRRLTPMPDDFDLLDTLMNNWVDTDNKHNVDFALYSTHLDAFYDTNRWTHCNFNYNRVGFPRDCGPTSLVGNQWNAYSRSGGSANTHAFLIPVNPSFESKVTNIALGRPAAQQGTVNGGIADHAVDGNTVGIYNWGSTTRTEYQEDPWWLVELEHNATIDKVYFWTCIDGCKRPSNVRVEVLDSLYGDVVSEKFIEGQAKVMNVVDFEGVVGQVVRITRETPIGSKKYLSLADVQIEGTLGAAIEDELFAKVDADEYSSMKGIYMHTGGETIGCFHNGDHMTYESLNFGPLGTTKSIRVSYAKKNTGGRMEIRLGGPEGTLIGELYPSRTASWSDYQDAYVNIKKVEGVHDVTFVGRDKSGVLNLENFELTDVVSLAVSTKYAINDNNGVDVQCRYEVLRAAFEAQVFNVTDDGSSTLDSDFFAYLDVSTLQAAETAVDDLCASAQGTIDDEV
jgi:hypothetical protein